MTRKSYRVIIRIEAEVDITDAAVWYHRQQAGLGDDFLAEVETSIAGAAENPFRYPCLRRKPEVRRALVERFPYRVSSFAARTPLSSSAFCTAPAMTANGSRMFRRINLHVPLSVSLLFHDS